MRIPIVYISYGNDPWMELRFVEAEDKEAALIQEAQRIVSERSSSPGKPPSRVNPDGVQGSRSRAQGVVIQTLAGNGEWTKDATLVAPIYNQGPEKETLIPIFWPNNDWRAELLFVVAKDRETALIQEAHYLVGRCNDNAGRVVVRIDPKGVQGGDTPVQTIAIQRFDADGEWRDDTALFVPAYAAKSTTVV